MVDFVVVAYENMMGQARKSTRSGELGMAEWLSLAIHIPKIMGSQLELPEFPDMSREFQLKQQLSVDSSEYSRASKC